MADLAEILAGLEQGVERLSKAVDSYLPVLERKRKAEAERKLRGDKKKADLEFLKALSAKVERLHRIVQKFKLKEIH